MPGTVKPQDSFPAFPPHTGMDTKLGLLCWWACREAGLTLTVWESDKGRQDCWKNINMPDGGLGWAGAGSKPFLFSTFSIMKINCIFKKMAGAGLI